MATPATHVDELLARDGYALLRGVVPPEAVDRALRHLHLDVVRNGLPAETLGEWLWAAHWFPHLKWDEPIAGLAELLPDELRTGDMCDPQILLQPPDEATEVTLEPHVDKEPDWANGRRYARIVGVALSAAGPQTGNLVVWPLDGRDPVPLEVEPGDVVVMHPRLPHTSGLNREGRIRYAIYFRYLESEA